jgi:adenylate cyclase
MLHLRALIAGSPRTFPLLGEELRIGRGTENEIVLSDPSVSRRHASVKKEGDVWFVVDHGSTNGLQVNQTPVKRAPVKLGDRVRVGIFELTVEGDEAEMAAIKAAQAAQAAAVSPDGATRRTQSPTGGSGAAAGSQVGMSSATIVRSLADFTAEYGGGGNLSETMIRQDKRKQLDVAYESKLFGFLTRLARLLMTTDDPQEILVRVMDIAFEALPVDRGFILLKDDATGVTRCALGRWKDRVEHHPQSEVPVSNTMLDTVMNERVALLTYDAQSDQRLQGGDSIRIHQIRSAMCAPLWSGERISGVIQVDSPFHVGTFTEKDLDLLTALANYAAVAMDRLSYQREAETERQNRARLERYHSPAVIDDILRGGETMGGAARRLRQSHASVLFGDLVGFTTLSESASPEVVADLLEGYFTHAVEAIFAAGGTLDKFIGDCVMAFFGAPVEQADHAERAVKAALEIQRALFLWNAERRANGQPEAVARIAVNSGPVVVGDVGSKRRVDYTVLGTTVNVASRLESIAPPGGVIIGVETQRLLDPSFHTEPMGEFQLKGLTQKIAAYRVLPA